MRFVKGAGALPTIIAAAITLATPLAARAEGAGGAPPGLAKKAYDVGERLPAAYVGERRHLLSEPERYGLHAAPAGFRWVVIDRDAYLVRTRTGVITDVVTLIG